MTMHVIDYEIIGDDLQFVEGELDPAKPPSAKPAP